MHSFYVEHRKNVRQIQSISICLDVMNAGETKIWKLETWKLLAKKSLSCDLKQTPKRGPLRETDRNTVPL